jgi:acyl-CoA thioesterase-1
MRSRILLVAVILFSAGVGLVGCAGLGHPDEIIYAAYGASDAVGIGAVPLKKGYVWRIRDALDERVDDVRLLNLGVPAADVRGIEDVLILSLRAGLRPDLVTLWAGVNDIVAGDDADAFESRLENILARLRDETSAVVVMADIPDLTRVPRFVEHPSPVVTSERVDAFNAAIRRQAQAFEVPLVVFSGADIPRECVSGIDGFHPNNRGHKLIAEFFLRKILPALGLSD